MPPSTSHRLMLRTPGVSSSTPPPGTGISDRNVVVWRPRWSLSRTSPVTATSLPTIAFTRVDFPTPDGPSSTAVRPGRSAAVISSIPAPVLALTTITSTRPMRSRTASPSPSASSVASDLFRTTTGRAPLSHATTSSRSMRFGLGSRSRPTTMNATSTLAATTCGRGIGPEPRFESSDHRGRIASIDGSPSARGGRSATQSPTTGRSALVAVIIPSAVATTDRSRSTRAMRPGTRSVPAWVAKRAMTRSSAPYGASAVRDSVTAQRYAEIFDPPRTDVRARSGPERQDARSGPFTMASGSVAVDHARHTELSGRRIPNPRRGRSRRPRCSPTSRRAPRRG